MTRTQNAHFKSMSDPTTSCGETGALKRLLALSIFCLMTAINGFSWLMFDPAKDQLNREFSPHFTSTQLTLLSSWQPIMYLLTAPFATAMLVKEDGLRRVMKLGCGLELAGATLKLLACVAPHQAVSLMLLHLGQILSACVSPIAIGTPAHLSAVWFPEAQRARATGAAVLSADVGNALAYLLVPAIANAKVGYPGVVVIEFSLAVLCICAAWMFLPPQPKPQRIRAGAVGTLSEPLKGGSSGGGAHDDEAHVDVWSETKSLFRMPSAVILCVVYSWVSGGFVAWNSLFDSLLSGLWSDEFIGTLTFASTVAYVLGGSVAAVLVDSYFRDKMQQMLVASCAVSAVACALLTFSVPSDFTHSPTKLLLNWGDAWLVSVFMLCGFANGSAAPVFYELMAEISYPISEGVSGNVLSYFENIGALLLYQGVGNFADGKAMNIVFTCGMALTVVGLRFVRPALNRHQYEAAQSGGLADIDTFEAAYALDHPAPPIASMDRMTELM